MAIDMLLVFVKGASTRTIKKWGWLYCLVCYGGPFGIALACLLVRAPGKGSIYGDAGVSRTISSSLTVTRLPGWLTDAAVTPLDLLLD